MDRRSFLGKICSLIPFVVALSATGDSGTFVGQRRSGTRLATKEEIKRFNLYYRQKKTKESLNKVKVRFKENNYELSSKCKNRRN